MAWRTRGGTGKAGAGEEDDAEGGRGEENGDPGWGRTTATREGGATGSGRAMRGRGRLTPVTAGVAVLFLSFSP